MYCACGNISENEETGECASCAAARRKIEKQDKRKLFKPTASKPIAKISLQMSRKMGDYSKLKAEFIKDKLCPVTGSKAEDVHHTKGRIGFADEWARQNNIPLLIDTRFWLAVSRNGHTKINDNPAWAIANGYSLQRNEEINQTNLKDQSA